MNALYFFITAVVLFFFAALPVPFPFGISPGWLGIFFWSLALVTKELDQFQRFSRVATSLQGK